MNRNLQLIIIALILVMIGGMVYKHYHITPVRQDEESSMVLAPTEQEIETALENGESIWLLFRSATCAPCVEMQQIFDELKPGYEGKVRFIDVDVNDRANVNLLRQYKLQYVPASYIMDGQGNITYHNVGLISQDKLTAELDRVVKQ
jgi:thioredoxin-like negative regulator of GroEL